MLKLVPTSLREAALLPVRRAGRCRQLPLRGEIGVVTGVLLAMARITGKQFLCCLLLKSVLQPTRNPWATCPCDLPVALSLHDNWVNLAWGGAL
jgi:ABC-type phosphate transport system permease subunit